MHLFQNHYLQLLQDLFYLKGHRSVGGMRASIYNSMKKESVLALRDFMQDFEKQHG